MIEQPARRRKKFAPYSTMREICEDGQRHRHRPSPHLGRQPSKPVLSPCQILAVGSPIRSFGGSKLSFGGSKLSFAGSIPSFGPSKLSFGGSKRTRGGKSERNCQLFSVHLQRIRTLIVSIDLFGFCLSLSITKTVRRRAPLTPPPPAASLLAYRIGRRAA